MQRKFSKWNWGHVGCGFDNLADKIFLNVRKKWKFSLFTIFPTLKCIPAYLKFRFDTLLGYFLVNKPTIILLFRVRLLPHEVRKNEQTLKVFLSGVSGRPSQKNLSKVLDFFVKSSKLYLNLLPFCPHFEHLDTLNVF